jgi:hypothetical protein
MTQAACVADSLLKLTLECKDESEMVLRNVDSLSLYYVHCIMLCFQNLITFKKKLWGQIQNEL